MVAFLSGGGPVFGRLCFSAAGKGAPSSSTGCVFPLSSLPPSPSPLTAHSSAGGNGEVGKRDRDGDISEKCESPQF